MTATLAFTVKIAFVDRYRERCGIQDWTPHDLRRTAEALRVRIRAQKASGEWVREPRVHVVEVVGREVGVGQVALVRTPS